MSVAIVAQALAGSSMTYSVLELYERRLEREQRQFDEHIRMELLIQQTKAAREFLINA